MPSKDECDKAAKKNRQLAVQADREGKHQIASDARRRAIEWEKDRDSWWYRTFGW